MAHQLVSDWIAATAEARAPTADEIRGWLESVRADLVAKSLEVGTTPREWSCTLLGAICSPTYSAFVQIGDGAVVSGIDAVQPAFWPQSGEYANQTVFLVSPDAIAGASIVIGGAVDRIALLSDGLQPLALEYQKREAFAPFFTPLFAGLAESADMDAYETKLLQLLASRHVNQRTNDDKTLVIALRAEHA